MNYQHQQLASGRWQKLSFFEQMANIGSEVERSINWKNKGNLVYADKAFERALELFDLTAGSNKNGSKLKEILRAREMFADFFAGKISTAQRQNNGRFIFSPLIMRLEIFNFF